MNFKRLLNNFIDTDKIHQSLLLLLFIKQINDKAHKKEVMDNLKPECERVKMTNINNGIRYTILRKFFGKNKF